MRSDADGLHHRSHFIRTRQHDYIQAPVDFHQLLQRVNAVHFRHQNVENDEVGPLAFLHSVQGFPAGVDRLHVEPVHFQKGLQILSNTRLVIHHQNFFFLGH